MPSLLRSSRPAPTRRLPQAFAALALTVGALTGCSADSAGDSGAATTSAGAASSSAAESDPAAPSSADAAEAQTVTATEGEMFIELSEDSFSAGTYTIEVTNDGSGTHDFVVERDGNDVAGTDSIGPGSSASLTVDLEPGEYVFYCSVGNHRAMGMEVTVTVT